MPKPAGALKTSNQTGTTTQDSSSHRRGRGDRSGWVGETERGLGDKEDFGSREPSHRGNQYTVPVMRESSIQHAEEAIDGRETK